ncbi:MAG: PAS domain-containing sensor histidine kinase [Flavobacteriales bacterium]|nr:PAS domain-containing sensor histidine kinase [Flavobacteriales bacterium]
MGETEIYKLVYEIVTEAMILANRNGIIIDANPSAVAMFKYPMEKLIGMNVDQLLPDALRNAHAKHREGFVEKPQKRSMGSGMELCAQDSEGNQIPVEVSLNHANFDGEFRVVALITDITTRKEAADRMLQLNKELEEGVKQRTKDLDAAVKALEESQHLYTLIAQNFPDGTINVLDRKLNYIFAEGKEFVRSGIDRRKVIGLNYISLLPVDFRQMVETELNRVFEGLPRSFEIVARGNTFIMSAVPLYDEIEGVNRILLVEKNITEQKQAERDMVAALKKERELNEMKSRFVSMASHEFRTPLATVLSSVNLVSRHAEANNQEGITKHVGRIRNSVRNLTSILNDFLSLEKLEQGKVQFKPEDFDMCSLAVSVTEEISGMTKEGQSIRLDCCKQNTCSGRIVTNLDPQLIRNILFNLLSNAVKYSKENMEIVFSVDIGDNLVLKVQDHGMGIPTDEQQHLFERFFRAKNATNIQGTGLGLNIVQKHVDLMGGTIDFTSKLNEGTTFIITLPTQQPEPE